MCCESRADSAAADGRKLTELTLEELMNLPVTLVSRKAESRSGASAAIAVVPGDDLRRLGVTAIPEALRMVPGVHVARIDASEWAVASRGFSSLNSSKLLVLMDGRSAYTPLFSGVLWDVQDTLLEDVDRIEVVRGPGASLWGANAVNGVINVVTKSARDTHGLYLEGGGGQEERGFGGIRYGGALGEDFHYRVYGKYFERDGFVDAGPTDDDWRMGRFGFRTDWDASHDDEVTVQGDVYTGDVGQLRPAVEVTGRAGPEGDLEADVAGGNVLGRWQRTLENDSTLELQAYYDRTHRDDPTYEDDLHTFDADLQHGFRLTERQQILWGAAYRLMSDEFRGKGVAELRPIGADDQLVSGFVQDEIAFLDGSLRLTVGTKLEHNDFSGFEVQPTGRIAYDPAERQTIWAAVSRAVRVPTRIERDVFIEASPPGQDPRVLLLGNHDMSAEELLAFELGYRVQPADDLSFDVTTFYNRYDRLATLELDPQTTDEDGRVVLPVFAANRMHGEGYGVEVAAAWSPRPGWRFDATYSYLELQLHPESDSLDINRAKRFEDSTPHNQVYLWSFVDLPRDLELGAMFRFVDNIGKGADRAEETGTSRYFSADAQLAWRATDALELAVVGRNLLESSHVEFPGGAEIDRGAHGRVSWRWQ
ncbi:MAG: iron complex outerrane recepter protein [Candidatus Binatota bacterium]|nr:iron complex outerrane recepter protein [Candidatus Binatota bacterium]